MLIVIAFKTCISPQPYRPPLPRPPLPPSRTPQPQLYIPYCCMQSYYFELHYFTWKRTCYFKNKHYNFHSIAICKAKFGCKGIVEQLTPIYSRLSLHCRCFWPRNWNVGTSMMELLTLLYILPRAAGSFLCLTDYYLNAINVDVALRYINTFKRISKCL